MFPKDVLNRIRWTGNQTLEGVSVWVLHRGAPNDRRIVRGEEITLLENSFFLVVRSCEWNERGGERGEDVRGEEGDDEPHDSCDPGWEEGRETRIPYHRIQKISLNGDVAYDRKNYRANDP